MPRERGTFEPSQTKKIGVVLPEDLAHYFLKQVDHKPSEPHKEAILIWLALNEERFAQIRDAARKAAKLRPEEAVKVVREKIVEFISNGLIQEYVASLSRAERGKIMLERERAHR